jgi:hypothetical protein
MQAHLPTYHVLLDLGVKHAVAGGAADMNRGLLVWVQQHSCRDWEAAKPAGSTKAKARDTGVSLVAARSGDEARSTKVGELARCGRKRQTKEAGNEIADDIGVASRPYSCAQTEFKPWTWVEPSQHKDRPFRLFRM